MKIWYITRSYYPSITGGTIIRKSQVDLFKNLGFYVEVVKPCYDTKTALIDSINKSVFVSNAEIKIGLALERLGIFEDYLDNWAKKTYLLLRGKVSSKDLIFATSGGELGCLKLGAMLKRFSKCRLVFNYHDPLDYSYVNGLRLNDRFHVNREISELKYLKEANLIVTSSEVNKRSLQKKFPFVSSRVYCNYFGYVSDAPRPNRKSINGLNFAYGGTFSKVQSPHLLAIAAKEVSNINITFIGDYLNYSPLRPFRSTCTFIKTIPYNEYLQFMAKNIDVGFLSLADDYLGACVPSKLYEYINLGMPILAALPDGDAKDIINNCGYGIAVGYNDPKVLRDAIELMKDKTKFEKFRARLYHDRPKWAMKNRFKELTELFKTI